MKKVYFKTFGCRTNLYDSQVMMSSMDDYEITENEDEADSIVINSCTVTNGADSHVRSYISHIEKTTGAKIFLTGCGAHTKGEKLLSENRVHGVFGQSEKQKIDFMLSGFLAERTTYYLTTGYFSSKPEMVRQALRSLFNEIAENELRSARLRRLEE